MLYSKIAELYEKLGSTSKRLEKTRILSTFLEYLHEDDKDILYLLLGEIYPAYDERKIGISNQIAIKAISKATGISESQITKDWRRLGDLGEVAEELIKRKKQSTLHSQVLTSKKILENLRKLPELEGKGTVEKKLSLILELLTSASPLEAKYLTRTLIGDLRMGVKESTIREAISSAFFENQKEASEKIQQAIDLSNDLGVVFEISRKRKIEELKEMPLQIGKPIKAMLSQKVSTISEGLKSLGKPCAIEYKYDGFRIMVHKKGKEIFLFTRRLEDVTRQFPEAVDYVSKYVKGGSFILDSEAVGFNKKTKEYTSFQNISQRIKRKYDIEKLRENLPVEINVFDVIYYNGKSLLNEPFKNRTELLKKIIEDHPYKIIHAKQIITGEEKEIEDFYKKALKDNQEGIMMKNLNACYQPGNRVGHMLKFKPETHDLDLVITGAEYGTGKRGGWMSSFILSCRGEKDMEYLTVGKVGTGIKEKSEEGVSFKELTNQLTPYIASEKGRSVTINPKIVVAVTYQEIQKSPNYNSGFALRFPRLTSLRSDKPLSEIATLEEIKKEFENKNNEVNKKTIN